MSSNRRLFWLSFLVAAIAVLFGWSAAENAGDLRTCELSVGAINDANAKVDIRRVTTSAFSRVIRIDYDLALPNRKQPFSRFAICHFAASQTPPFHSGLAMLTTEAGPLPEANLYMLRRFYLDTGEAASTEVPAIRTRNPAGFRAITAHMAEWLLSVASQASPLALMAFVFLTVANLLRTMPPNMFYGVSAACAAGIGALLTTGNISRIAPALAITAGIVNGGSVLILYAETMKERMKAVAPRFFPWLLFGAFAAMALFWFPDRGMFGPHHLPPFLLQPVPLTAIAGYALSATPLVLGLIVMAVLAACFMPVSSRENPSSAAFPGFIGFLGLMMLTGILSAFGCLQFGLGPNPLLLATKALLITLAALAAPPRGRGLQILLSSLALVSVEYALAPFLAKPVADLISYGLLFLLLIFTGSLRRQRAKQYFP